MARKLPWTNEPQAPGLKRASPNSSTPKRTRHRRSLSQPSQHDASHASDDALPAVSSVSATPSKRQTTIKYTARRPHHSSQRTPSTSPPPGPPPNAPMRPGYDADDIYMMVEDEFHATAQTFTHHLHHAEYKRLQGKARDAQRERVPVVTDGMRAETRKKIEGGLVRERQRAALDLVLRGEGDEDEVTKKVHDPWIGTSLAEFMSGASQQRRALVGLEQVRSSTKAAKGFKQAEQQSPERNRGSRSDGSRANGNGRRRRDEEHDADEEEWISRTNTKTLRAIQEATTTDQASDDATDAPPVNTRHPESRPGYDRINGNFGKKGSSSQPKPRNFLDELHDFTPAPDASDGTEVATAKSISATKVLKSKLDKDKARKKKQFNEIPTFLV